MTRNSRRRLREVAGTALAGFVRLPDEVVPRIRRIAFDPSESIKIRDQAVQALGKAGRNGVSAVSELSATLISPAANLDLRIDSARSLGKIATEAQISEPTEALTRVVRDSSEKSLLRVVAANALQNLGPLAKGSVPSLVDLAVNENQPPDLRIAVLDSMKQMGPISPPLFERLKIVVPTRGDDLRVRIKVAQALNSVRNQEATQVAELIALAEDLREVPELRRAAVDTIRYQDCVEPGVTAGLVRLLGDPRQDTHVRMQAGTILAQVKPLPKGTVPQFVTILGNPSLDIDLRRGVASAAGSTGPDGSDLVPVLTNIIASSKDIVLRRQSCVALNGIHRNGGHTITILENIIRDEAEDLELRRDAATAIGAIEKDDKTGNQRVTRILRDILRRSTDKQMRLNAASQLGQVDSDEQESILLLSQVMGNTNEDLDVRTRAISALGSIARINSISQITPDLLKILQDEQEQSVVRQTAAGILPTIQPTSQSAVVALIEVAKNSRDQQVRVSATNALGVVGEGSTTAASMLSAIVTNKTEKADLRATAARGSRLNRCRGAAAYSVLGGSVD